MGVTAEEVAKRHGLSREAQDRFAEQSYAKALAAIAAGKFKAEIVPVMIAQKKGDPKAFEVDEDPSETTFEMLSKLRPAFVKENGTVTAGNASGINDGASALLLVAADAAFGLTPLARIVSSAVAGVDPSVMGIGPVPAVRKALDRAGLDVPQIDLWELNEAFASQSLACIRDLRLEPEKVNVYGGAIALGHALGSSGSRIMTTLVHALRRRSARYGVATMCIGVGQGIAVVVERL
jgi:acetyl-CoA acetyltransferase family protein